MARTNKAVVPALPPTPETPAEPVLPPTLVTPAAPAEPVTPVTPAEPELTEEGPYRVRHKVSGEEFEVSKEYLETYRSTLEIL